MLGWSPKVVSIPVWHRAGSIQKPWHLLPPSNPGLVTKGQGAEKQIDATPPAFSPFGHHICDVFLRSRQSLRFLVVGTLIERS